MRVVGVVLLVMGFALAALLMLILVHRSHGLAGFTAGAVAIVTFLLLLGYRLAFNRPNRRGSLLSPISWMVLAVAFAVLAVFSVVTMRAGNLTQIGPTLAAALLAYLCFLAARGVRYEPAAIPSSRIFPPETSLLDMEGFTPAGFQCGLEILNDDRTPMVFVVSVLEKHLGLKKQDAIRTMLDIHSKGGVLLARDSFEESQQLAEAVSAEVRLGDYPLICRAVRVERS